MDLDVEYKYMIGDVVFNSKKDKYYVIVDYDYKSTSVFYTIKDLLTDKIIINEWLHSNILIWNKGNFIGYEKEYRLASMAEALSKYRKSKIKKFLDLEGE